MREGPLVAIVDDDKSIRNATQDLLKAAGFSTATFEDAESFLGSASRAGAACVVADMRMPAHERASSCIRSSSRPATAFPLSSSRPTQKS